MIKVHACQELLNRTPLVKCLHSWVDFCICHKIPVAGRFLPGILEVNATWIWKKMRDRYIYIYTYIPIVGGRFFELVMDGCFLVGSCAMESAFDLVFGLWWVLFKKGVVWIKQRKKGIGNFISVSQHGVLTCGKNRNGWWIWMSMPY